MIEPEYSHPDVDEWKPFNYIRSASPRVGMQFYGYDYQFARLWNAPGKYLPMLSRVRCCLSPDFSIYTNVPDVLGMYNHYRKHWLAAYWQQNGIQVFPTICWGDEKTFDWCFLGEPHHSVVSVSSVGTQKSKESKEMFMYGYDAMLERLQPSHILFFGNVPKEARGSIVNIPAYWETVQERGKRNAS